MISAILCKNCNTSNNSMIECLECGMGLDSGDCQCYLSKPEGLAHLFCHNCNYNWDLEIDTFIEDIEEVDLTDITCLTDKDLSEQMAFEGWDDTWTGSYGYQETLDAHIGTGSLDWGVQFIEKCRHLQVELEFPSGVKVYPSSFIHSGSGRKPDFALYLDDAWNSPGFAYYIEWTDFGLPHENDWDDALMAISDVYKKARNGLFVEIGCIGGHGRTGTALACMLLLEGVEASAAIQYIRKNYCNHAIEGEKQEWFVKYAEAFYNSGITPQFPKEEWYYDIKEAFDWEEFDINNHKSEHTHRN